jgi:hypothetical protein
VSLHVICERDAGLFSLIQQVIAHLPWALRAGRVPVVLFESRCCYWVPHGYRDRSTVWEYYFEPLDRSCPAEAVPEKTRSALAERFPDPRDVGFWLDRDAWVSNNFGDHPRLKGKTLAIPYGWQDPDAATRARAAPLIREHLRPRKYLSERVDAFFGEHMHRRTVIGVQIRGTDAVSNGEDRAHRKDSLVLENYRREVERCLASSSPDARLFVATDDQRSLDFMTGAFGDRVIAYDSLRHAGGEAAGRGPTGRLMPAYVAVDRLQAARNGEEAVIEYLLLARCALLVHNGSSLARTVLLSNPALPHVNTHRKNKLLAQVQTLSFRKLRRTVRRALRRAKPARLRPSTDG